jgi:FkbM family methyltransferase
VWSEGVGYEAPFPGLLADLLAAEDSPMFFDVGSNMGFFSFFMAARVSGVRIHAFEPNPRLYDLQRRNVARNGLATIWDSHNCALGDRPSAATLEISALNSGWSNLGKNPHFAGQEPLLNRIEVPIMRFDDWRRQAGLPLPVRPAWVAKIDVEGCEPQVVRGMAEALHGRAFKALCVEVLTHTLAFFGETPTKLTALLRAHGYHPFDANLQPASIGTEESRNLLFLAE